MVYDETWGYLLASLSLTLFCSGIPVVVCVDVRALQKIAFQNAPPWWSMARSLDFRSSGGRDLLSFDMCFLYSSASYAPRVPAVLYGEQGYQNTIARVLWWTGASD